MTALTIPQEVAAECAKKLFVLATTANRDAMTLIKQAMALAKNEEPARPLATLKKYVREYDQYGSAEVGEVVAAIEAAADPEHVKRLNRIRAKNDAQRAKFAEDCKAAEKRAWQPGGDRWNSVIKSAEKYSRALSLAAEVMRAGEADRPLVKAMRKLYEDDRTLWRIGHSLPYDQYRIMRGEEEFLKLDGFSAAREDTKHAGDNVVTGPWDTAS